MHTRMLVNDWHFKWSKSVVLLRSFIKPTKIKPCVVISNDNKRNDNRDNKVDDNKDNKR